MSRGETPFARAMRILVPVAVGVGFLVLWEVLVRASGIKPFVLSVGDDVSVVTPRACSATSCACMR